MDIHSTAVVHPSLDLPPDLAVGPYSIVESGVSLAPGVRIGPFCHIYPGSILEAGARLEDGVIVGNTPQDLKYRGEPTGVRVGAGAWLREYATINRSVDPRTPTAIGSEALIMAYAHIAHDCEIGARAVIANGVQMAGHVRVGEGAVVSGMTGIHQFVSIGAGAFVGGNLRVDKDVLPFSKAMGEPLRYAGLNLRGLARAGLGAEASAWLGDAYRRIAGEGLEAALAALASGIGSEGATDSGSDAPERGPRGEREDLRRLRALLADFLAHRKRGLLTRPLN